MASIPSTQALSTQYLNNVAAQNPNLNPYAEGGDFFVKSLVYGMLLSGCYADIYLKFLNVFTQNLAGEYVDKALASFGLPQRQPAFAAQGIVTPTTAPSTTITLPANTQLAIPNSGFNYLIAQETTILANTLPLIPIVSQALGAGTSQAPDAILTLVNPISGAPTFKIVYMVDGGEIEEDSQCITRILNKQQNPLLGGAIGDYKFWAMSQADITGAFVVPNIGSQNIVGVYVLAGGFNYDVILENPSIPYTRTATPAQIQTVYNYIETQRPVTVSFTVASVETYIIPQNIINVGVELVPNMSLSTLVPGTGLTAEELILREIRRAVITTPTGGYRPTPTTAYILASDISNSLGLGLSAQPGLTGLYATILLDWEVTLTGGNPNYPVPLGVLDDGNYPYVYDILYANTNVTIMQDG